MIERSVVSIVRIEDDAPRNIDKAVREAISLTGDWEKIVSYQDLILIKPNLVAVPSDRLNGAVTRWEVCKVVADLVRETGGRPVIADSAAVGVNTEEVMQATGYLGLREVGYEVVDLKTRPKVVRKIPEGRVLKEVTTFDLVEEAKAIVSVPVMKTHDQTEITVSLKNLKGLIDDKDKRRLHQEGVLHGVLDLQEAFRTAFAVVDGTFCQEGLGPIHGHTVEMGLILAGSDLVAVDAMAGRIMGFPPEEVLITQYGAERGLGISVLDRIEIKGEPWEKVKRRFMRSAEDKRVDVRGLQILHAEGSCTGCRNTVVSALFDMKRAGQVEYLEDMVIVTGPGVEVPAGTSIDHLVSVGVCVSWELRGEYFARGCPPNNSWVVEQVLKAKGAMNSERGR